MIVCSTHHLQSPIPLIKNAKQELDWMEWTGVIEKVTEPTEWCMPMVSAPKKSDKVRLKKAVKTVYCRGDHS